MMLGGTLAALGAVGALHTVVRTLDAMDVQHNTRELGQLQQQLDAGARVLQNNKLPTPADSVLLCGTLQGSSETHHLLFRKVTVVQVEAPASPLAWAALDAVASTFGWTGSRRTASASPRVVSTFCAVNKDLAIHTAGGQLLPLGMQGSAAAELIPEALETSSHAVDPAPQGPVAVGAMLPSQTSHEQRLPVGVPVVARVHLCRQHDGGPPEVDMLFSRDLQTNAAFVRGLDRLRHDASLPCDSKQTLVAKGVASAAVLCAGLALVFGKP